MADGVSIATQIENISRPCQNARQPPAQAPCLPTPMQTDAAAAAISEFVRCSRQTKLERSQQIAAAAICGNSSPDAPETPVRGAKRSASEAFGAYAERWPGSKILKALGSGAADAPVASHPRANLACAERLDPPQRSEAAAMNAASQRHHKAPEVAEAASEADLIYGDAPSLIFLLSFEKLFQLSV